MGAPSHRLALLAAVVVSLAVPGRAAEQARKPPPGSLAGYLGIAARWRADDPGAIRELRGWRFFDLDQAVAALAHRKESLAEVPTAGQIDLRLAEAAVMMHASATLVSIRDQSTAEAAQHARSAIAVLEAVHAAAARRPPGAAPLRPRIERALFYAALSAAALSLGDLGVADDLGSEGLRHDPADAQLLYVVGCVKEALAILHATFGRPAESRRSHRDAEKLFRDALAVAPDNTEGRLRLAAVLLQEDRPLEAQPLLETVCRDGDARLRYLGWLFLGDLFQRSRDWTGAASAYGQAIREQPDNQAARLGLASVLEQQSGPAAARPLVLATLSLSGRLDRDGDPWWSFPLGPYKFAAEALERLQKRVMAP